MKSSARAYAAADVDTTQTLEELTDDPWPDPAPGDTSLQERTTLARRLPLDRLTPEHLRSLLGQQVDLGVVLPLAADRLAADPMMGGDHYAGDVLEAALQLPAGAWDAAPAARATLAGALTTLDRDGEDVDAELGGLIDRFLG